MNTSWYEEVLEGDIQDICNARIAQVNMKYLRCYHRFSINKWTLVVDLSSGPGDEFIWI